MTLDEILAHAARVAREAFSRRGEVAPMWAGHRADGELVMFMPERFNEAAEKQAATDAVRALFKQKGVVMFSFMTEAWMLDSTRTVRGGVERAWLESHRTGKGLGDHPDRIEVVFIQAEDKERCITGHYRILRPEHGKPTLAPFKKLGPMGPGIGRAFGILKDKEEAR